jgi:hypothetical protein
MTITDPTKNLSLVLPKSLLREVAIAFSAGSFGGLTNSLTVWLFGLIGIPLLLGVKIAPALTPAWLYPRLVWGGLWGFLFLLPIYALSRKPFWVRGLWLSLVPTLVQLLLVFPIKDGRGLLGLSLGVLTPLFVLLFNAVWGFSTAFLLEQVKVKPEPSSQDTYF